MAFVAPGRACGEFFELEAKRISSHDKPNVGIWLKQIK